MKFSIQVIDSDGYMLEYSDIFDDAVKSETVEEEETIKLPVSMHAVAFIDTDGLPKIRWEEKRNLPPAEWLAQGRGHEEISTNRFRRFVLRTYLYAEFLTLEEFADFAKKYEVTININDIDGNLIRIDEERIRRVNK